MSLLVLVLAATLQSKSQQVLQVCTLTVSSLISIASRGSQSSDRTASVVIDVPAISHGMVPDTQGHTGTPANARMVCRMTRNKISAMDRCFIGFEPYCTIAWPGPWARLPALITA